MSETIGGKTYCEIVEPYVAAIRMVREAIGELFGPIANLESEEAELLRGPLPHHSAEAQIAALQRVANALSNAGVAVRELQWTRSEHSAKAQCSALGWIDVYRQNDAWDYRIGATTCYARCETMDAAITEAEDDRIASIRSALAPASKGWRDIKDAPRDGTDILGAHEHAAIVVYWQPDGTVDGAPGWAGGETDDDGLLYTYPVTHFMPLPPLPASPFPTGGEAVKLTAARRWALQAIADGYGRSPATLGQRMMERPGVVRRGGAQGSAQGHGRIGGMMTARLVKDGLATAWGWPTVTKLTPAGRLALDQEEGK